MDAFSYRGTLGKTRRSHWSRFASLVLSSVCLATCEVRYNEPFQIIRPNDDHDGILPVTDGLQKLARVSEKISILAVVGPYHSGKSFLLNALVGNPTVFTIGRRTSPETMGIWLCRTELRSKRDGSEVWLLDSEGFFGPHVTAHYDAKIFTVATLLGGHLVYNTVKIIDQQAVNLLQMLAQQARLFRTRSSAESSGLEPPDFLSVRSFPNLTWVVEDFIQELPEQYRYGGGPTAWLKSYLAKTNDTDSCLTDTCVANSSEESREQFYLNKIYNDIQVHTLFLPATRKEHLTDLSQLEWGQLTPDFQAEVAALREDVLEKLEARKIEGGVVTGHSLERAIRFIVQALQRGMFHELPSLWATWTRQVAEMSLQDADTWFSSLLQKIDNQELPMPLNDFNVELEDARQKCVSFYKDLLRDFEVNLNIGELKNRMTVHFKSKHISYHERIQIWVGRLTSAAKDIMNQRMAAVEIPTIPEDLRKIGDNVSRASVDDFQMRLSNFARSTVRVRLGPAATMPAFAESPVTQLRHDLSALVGKREAENEREIEKHFKSARNAADEAVAHELKINSDKLVGKSAMLELINLVTVKAFHVLDERLARYRWMKATKRYEQAKEQVRSESVKSKVHSFEQNNRDRLTQHFHQMLESAVAAYKQRKAKIEMPVSESDLLAAHNSLATSVRDMLYEHRSDLMDTDQYKGSLRSLTRTMEEGYEHAVKKNVELWKVNSDEATRCAVKLNEKKEKDCDWLCAFNKVPHYHRTGCRTHLEHCLRLTSAGLRMPKSMQTKVFENWYDTDLAKDAQSVQWNFLLLMGIVVVLALLFCSGCCRSY